MTVRELINELEKIKNKNIDVYGYMSEECSTEEPLTLNCVDNSFEEDDEENGAEDSWNRVDLNFIP